MLPIHAGYGFQAAANSTLIVSRSQIAERSRQVVPHAKAGVDHHHSLPALGPGELLSKPRCAPSTTAAVAWTAVDPSIPWLAAKLLNIMSDNV
jgi:hypothetical protein